MAVTVTLLSSVSARPVTVTGAVFSSGTKYRIGAVGPGKVALAVSIARKTKRIVRENVVFALGVKFAVLILAAFGLTNMWVGVFADVGVAVLAILNAMRTLRGTR